MKALVINKEDLKYNIRTIKKIAEDTGRNDNHKPIKVIAVVKGNGYGLGLERYSKFLIDNGVNFLAVANVEEAIKLRKSGITTDILMLSSTAIRKEVETLVENNIILSIGSNEAGEMAENIAKRNKQKIRVHLKIDTGFGRYGFCYDKKTEMIEAIKEWKNLEICGVFSHPSLSFYEKDKYTQIQFSRYIDCIEALKENKIETGILHFCNSSAFLKYKEMRLNAVRIGSAFLGRLIIPNIYGLRKIGYLTSNISEIKELEKGYNVGYSNSYTTTKKTKIAIIQVGYSDGFNIGTQKDMFRKRDKLRYIVREIKNALKSQKLSVIIKGYECNILGRVGMCNVVIDITDKEIQINDIVEFNVNPIYVDSSIQRFWKG